MPKHIHITGCSPRSGTTLLAELFRTSFNIDGFYEHERSIFKCNIHKYDILISKSPVEVVYFPWLLSLNPDLWCIYILRDPRDVIVSTHSNIPDRYFSNLRIWKTYHAAAKRALNHTRFIMIKYEDLVSDPDRIQDYLVERINFLTCKMKFSDFGKNTDVSSKSENALGGVRTISNHSVGKWKHHLPRVKAQVELHGDISDELIKLNYETDKNWLSLLDGVDAEYTQGDEPDFLSNTKTFRNKYRVFRKVIYYAWKQQFQSPGITTTRDRQ